MIKTLLPILLLLTFSCQESTDESTTEIIKPNTASIKTMSTDETIIVNIYPFQSCSGGSMYAMYVSASNIVDFERVVYTMVITANNNLMEGRTFKIPANKLNSNIQQAFKTAPSQIGNAMLVPKNVYAGGVNISNQYNLISASTYISNCTDGTVNFNPCENDHDGDDIKDCEDCSPLDPLNNGTLCS